MSVINGLIKIALDAGHGINTAGKRTPDGEREWSFNNKVLLAATEELKKYKNVQILRLDDPTGKTDIPLTTRTNKANAWGADVLISIHHNANAGKWGSHGGIETFVHPTGARASYDIANLIQPRIVKAMGLRDRKVQKKNLHMVRESNMPGILTEGGFMDSTTDIKVMRNDAKLKEQGIAIANGLVAYFKLVKETKNVTAPISKSTRGIGLVKINTDGLSLRKAPSLTASVSRKLKKGEQYFAYDKEGMWYNLGAGLWVSEGSAKNHVTFTPNPKELYRVRKSWADVKSQIGAFHDIEAAKDLVDKNIAHKVYNESGKELYKYVAKVEPKPEPKPTPIAPKPEPTILKNPIMGKSIATVEQMVAFVEKENKDAKNLRDIALSFLEIGEKYGIRGDVAYCQSILETHWFKFDLGTAVTPDQHNYCGMGVTKKGMKGNSFKSVKDGVTAQIQHLIAYANKNELPIGEELLDPRFKYVTRGIAPNWEDLSMRWAMNENYGKHILDFHKKLIAMPILEVEEEIDLELILQWIRSNKEVQKTIIDLFKLWNEKGGK